MNPEPLIVDMSKPQELVKILPHAPVLSSQKINWAGLSCQEFHYSRHEIPEYVMPHHSIVVMLSGEVYHENRIDGKLYSRIRDKSELLIVPEQTTYSCIWEPSVNFLLLTLCPKLMRLVSHESIDPACVELISQSVVLDPLIHQIGLSLKADIEAGSPTGKIFGESAAVMLAARLLQQHSSRRPKQLSDEVGLSSYTLRLILDYIESHLGEDLVITDLAQVAGMSPYYFMRMFKRSMHITARQYIIQQRIDRAKELLRSGELSIAEISLRCGFTNQSHFTNVFHQLTKTTPKAYRRDWD